MTRAEASTNTGGHGGRTAAFGPLFVINRTGLAGRGGKQQGTDIATAFVLKQGRFGLKDVFEGHGETGLAQGQALGIEGAPVAASIRKRNRGTAVVVVRMEVFVDVKGVEGGIQGGEFGTEAQAALGGDH